MKKCRKCGEVKPLEAFVKDKRSKDERTARCKSCFNVDQRRRHAKRMENPEYRERHNARTAAWLAAHPEAGAESARRWRERHPERAQVSAAESYRRRLEQDPDYYRKWYQRNIEKERERSKLVMRRFRANDPERDKANRRRYRENNREIVRQREREKTYSRRAKQPYSVELATFMAELITQPCAYCDATENITIDHVVPLSRGGKHEADNLAPACYSCNASKCNRLLSEWPGRFR